MNHTTEKHTGLSIRALKSLVKDHVSASTPPDSRIRSIIRAARPSIPVENARLVDSDALSVINQEINDIENLIDNVLDRSSASIGLLEVQTSPGIWVAQGTCFRVGTNGRRMATAGHLLESVMLAPNRVRKSFPLKLRNSVRAARVNFNDNPAVESATRQQNIFTISEQSYIWAHPRWDLLLFDLDADSEEVLEERPALPLEDNHEWGEEDNNPVLVLGYPIAPDNTFSEADIFVGDLAIKRASPGLCRRPVGMRPPARAIPNVSTLKRDTSTLGHDASTLPGSSGSPVFSLISGKVVGLHYDGGRFVSDPSDSAADPNDAVNLPVALFEQSLKAEMFQEAIVVDEAPVAWDPDVPRWRAASSGGIAGQVALESSSSVLDDESPLFASVVADRADTRDRMYDPGLLEAQDVWIPKHEPGRVILDQKGEPACTAFALAGAINAQLIKLNRTHDTVSERMLYEMARLHDEWIDNYASGSSLRGVIKGFYQNGVCLSSSAPFRTGQTRWTLSITAAKEARSITLGAYFRLRPDLLDFQLALNETGAIVISAQVHTGWISKTRLRSGCIKQQKKIIGNHAFIIVGYDDTGFIIQNSWGEQWCSFEELPGFAHWSYNDWAENLIDAWVLRLSPSTPTAFDLVPRIALTSISDNACVTHRLADEVSLLRRPGLLRHGLRRPRRFSLIGHVFQIEHDRVVNQGRLGMGLDSLRETALYLGNKDGASKYNRVAFFFHDPLLGADALSRLSGHMIESFKRKGIYPIHIIYGIDTASTLKLRIIAEAEKSFARYGTDKDLSSFFESRAIWLIRPLLRIFTEGIRYAALPGNALWQAIASIASEMPSDCRINLFASGAGSLVAEQVLSMQGVPDISVTPDDPDSAFPVACSLQAWRGRFDSLFLIAPASSAETIEANSQGLKCDVASLSAQRDLCVDLPGYSGDWIDLVNCSLALDLPGSYIAREGASTTKHSCNCFTVSSKNLFQACADTKVIKKCVNAFKAE